MPATALLRGHDDGRDHTTAVRRGIASMSDQRAFDAWLVEASSEGGRQMTVLDSMAVTVIRGAFSSRK